MAKNEIRLQYSGFVIFAARILSVATGLIFQLMVARATTKPEYDLWFNLSDVSAYFLLLAGIIPFWTMRFVAREKEGAVKTGIVMNFVISTIAAFMYLSFIPLITSALGISQENIFLYFLISIQIIELYSISMVEACIRAKTPQNLGYGLLIAEISKIVLGYILIIQFNQPLTGAVLSILTAFAIQVIYYINLLSKELTQRIKWVYAREWLKGSVVNIYNVVGIQVAAFIFIMLFTYGGDGARSNYGAAAQIANVITYSSFLAFALYPKLLAKKKQEDITTSLRMVLMFAIPMTAGAITLSASYLTILRDVYAEAAPILTVLAIDALIRTTSIIFSSVLFGIEKFDEEAKISFKELTKSRLFFVFSIPYIQSAFTLPTAYYILTTFTQNKPVQAAIFASVINLFANLATLIILYIIIKKVETIDIPWRSIVKYILASAAMTSFLFLFPHPTRISSTLALTAIGGAIYLAVLGAIDKEARMLVSGVLKEVIGKVRSITRI